ncbi:sensor histidine kinase, partial [Streptomyces sp. M-16]|uniref:sensor histidine kinase n=1 Tax=Streptomyces sp. M-16 TaxID=3233040 RepID=UPI003F9C9B29
MPRTPIRPGHFLYSGAGASRGRSPRGLAMAAVAVREQRARDRLEGTLGQVAELSAARERNRLAREIHDSLGHHLTAIGIQLEKAEAFADLEPAASARAVGHARWSANRALDEVRASVRTLGPEARRPPLPQRGHRQEPHLPSPGPAGTARPHPGRPVRPGQRAALNRPEEEMRRRARPASRRRSRRNTLGRYEAIHPVSSSMGRPDPAVAHRGDACPEQHTGPPYDPPSCPRAPSSPRWPWRPRPPSRPWPPPTGRAGP